MDKMNTGIYCIENKNSGKRYIGSAVNIYNRWKEHRSKLNRKIHHAPHLQAAWNKYGEEAFEFKKMLVCSKENLIMYEQLCLDGYEVCDREKGYNASPTAGSNLGVKHSAEAVERRIAPLRGRKRPQFSKEWLEAMSRSHASKLDAEKVAAIRERAKTETHSLLAAEYNVCRQTITDTVRGNRWRHVPGRVLPSRTRKLTLAKAREIRALVAGGARNKDVAKIYSIGASTVCEIVKNRRWKELE